MTEQIGIEISSTAVRIARVGRRGTRAHLVAWGEAPLPLGAVVDGGVAAPDVVSGAVVAAARAAKIARKPLGSPKRARIAVSGLRAITRQAEMPAMPDDELEAAARLQALEVVPFPPDRALLSVRRLRSPEGSAEASVLLEAAHRDLVEPLVSVVSDAGFLVEGVELSSEALTRALSRGEEEGTEAIVSIGAELTTLVVHDRGEVRFVRTIAAGGAAVTRALSTALDVSFEEAEELKLRLGSMSTSSVIPAEAVAAARDASAVLLGEIRSSIIYYSSLPGASEVERVVLTGGGALLAGLPERLQFQMAGPVTRRSCLEQLGRVRVVANPAALADSGAVAIGLALAPAEAKIAKAAPGLLPPELLTARRNQRVERAVLIGAGVVLVAAVAGGAARFLQVHRTQQSVSSLAASIAVLQRSMPAYNKAQALDQTAVADEQFAQPLVADEVSWPAVLRALGAFTPAGVATVNLDGSSGAGPSGPASMPTAPTTGTSAALSSTDGAAAGTVVGSINLSLSSASYPGFQAWFDSLAASRYFQVVQYSGLTNSSGTVDFTAQLNLTGLLRSKRVQKFEGFRP